MHLLKTKCRDLSSLANSEKNICEHYILIILKDSFCRHVFGPTEEKEKISPTKELSTETMDRIVKLIQNSNSLWSEVKDAGYSKWSTTKDVKASG